MLRNYDFVIMIFISKYGSSHAIFQFLPDVLSSKMSPGFVTDASAHREIYCTTKGTSLVPYMG